MKQKDTYTFPAIFNYADDGISISFPDLPGCLSCAHTEEEALLMAKDALGGILCSMEKDDEKIPAPTPLNQIILENPEQDRAVLIQVFMPVFRNSMKVKYAHRLVKLPEWMCDAAEQRGIDLSKFMAESLGNALNQM